jgi:uncharacterized protein YjbJ (UPF0337 family)
VEESLLSGHRGIVMPRPFRGCSLEPCGATKLRREFREQTGESATLFRDISSQGQDTVMDKDRIAGAAKEAKGDLKDATGKVIGSDKLQAEGKADKAKGMVQNAFGQAKDIVRNAAKKAN